MTHLHHSPSTLGSKANLTRVSPGLYRNSSGQITRVISSRDKKAAAKVDGERKNQVRGREVSVNDSAADGQVIYGEMRVGGVYSYLNTNSESKAYLRTGSSNSQIVWIAKAIGSIGNGISVQIQCTGTNGSIIVTVVGDDITVRVKSSSGTSQSTATQVINAIKANSSANALVTVHQGDGDGTGLVQAEAVQNLAQGGGTWLHHYITIACHQIDSVQALYLDDRAVTFGATPDPRWAVGDFADHVFMAPQIGQDGQTVQPDLQAQVGPSVWTDDHRQRGCAGIYLITKWNSSIFDGMPEVSLLVRGKPCYDFRDGVTRWTQNAALIIADFLMDTKFGLGAALSDLDADSWTAAANVCDETVDEAARYQINGCFDTSLSAQQVLQDMVQAIGGDLVYQAGKWFCYPAKYRSPSFSFDERDVRGPVRLTTTVTRRDRFNAVKGTFVSTDRYLETDYPTVSNVGYILEDGIMVWGNINQPFVTRSTQAQRVAHIELERVRQGIEATVPFGIEALNVQIGDVGTFSYSKFGWDGKLFEVRDVIIEDTIEQGILVTLRLRETVDTIYADGWTPAPEADSAPNTNLPNPLVVGSPTDLTLSSGTAELDTRSDGTIFSRLKLVWLPPNDVFVSDGGHYDIQYKKSAESNWRNASPVPGDQSTTYILDVADGVAYDARIRAVNGIGTAGAWVTATGHIVEGKTAKPSNVSGFTGYTDSFGISLSWSAVPDLDVREYEIRLGASWDTATFIDKVRGNTIRLPIKTAGTYSFLVKAVDTSANYSVSATATSVTVASPAAPVVSYIIDGADIILSWDAVTAMFAIDSYEIRFGPAYEGGTVLGDVKSTTFRSRVNWGGNRTFWVTARDVAGNIGTPQSITIGIVLPGQPNNATVQALDNNALIRWVAAAAGSLPIDYYKLYKGDTFGAAEFLGDLKATFASQFELLSGTYTYWIVAVDTAGNVSAQVGVSVSLTQPPDFIFVDDYTFNPSIDETAITRAFIEDTVVSGGITAGFPLGLLLSITRP